MSDKIGFIFPGQGSQVVGMGQAFVENQPDLCKFYADASAILGYDLAALCFEGPAEQLNNTEFTQPALLVTSIVALQALGSVLKPTVVAGYSLGEYSALVAAGGISFLDAVQLVQYRAKFMAEAVPSDRGLVAAVLGLALGIKTKIKHFDSTSTSFPGFISIIQKLGGKIEIKKK